MGKTSRASAVGGAIFAALTLAGCHPSPPVKPQTFSAGEIVYVQDRLDGKAFEAKVVGVARNDDGSTSYVVDEGAIGLRNESPFDLAKTR